MNTSNAIGNSILPRPKQVKIMKLRPVRRRTKILATLNPKKITEKLVKDMILAGMNASRHNFSHSTIEEHVAAISLVRKVSADIRPVGIIVDLQGPKLRILGFRDQDSVNLISGEKFILDATCGENDGDASRVGLDYPELVHDVNAGDKLALADGLISLEVNDVIGQEIICTVINGGELGSRKGVNKIGGGLSAPAFTLKDKSDVKAIVHMKPDYFALSFVKTADDIREVRQLLKSLGCESGIISKIERHEALANIDEIIEESDAIMIARGDLGVEVGDPHLPGYQKLFIKKARTLNRCVITATQMMESMINSPIPTRAEVFDVANAVLDGTDTVMLSGETAAGKYPVKVIETMAEIVMGAEQEKRSRVSHHRIQEQFRHTEETIAMSAMFAVNHHFEGSNDTPSTVAILTLTESGQTPIYMSRISSGVSIYAMSPNAGTVGRLTLYRGVYPVRYAITDSSHADLVKAMMVALKKQFPEHIQTGDQVLITKGSSVGVKGGTNMLQIETIPE